MTSQPQRDEQRDIWHRQVWHENCLQEEEEVEEGDEEDGDDDEEEEEEEGAYMLFEHFRLREPVLEQLRRQLDKVSEHVCPSQAFVRYVRKHAVHTVSARRRRVSDQPASQCKQALYE